MQFEWQLREKDWNKRLTKHEAVIFKDWKDSYYSKVTDNYMPEDEEINKVVAKKYNMSAEEVDGILMKQMDWAFNDTSK